MNEVVRIYAMNKDGYIAHTAEKEDAHLFSFVYLHGLLEHTNDCDFVCANPKVVKKLLKEDKIYTVTLVWRDATEEECFLYLWHSPSKYKLATYGKPDNFAPVLITENQVHGLVCSFKDLESNEYALEQFNTRQNIC